VEDTGIGLFGLFAGAAGPFFLLAFLASLIGAWEAVAFGIHILRCVVTHMEELFL